MSVQTPEDPVLIIGAGLAGLALAQMLRKQNIPFQIFEREPAGHLRKQGWAVILVECLSSLEELLPDGLNDVRHCSVNHDSEADDSMALYDIDTLKQFALLGGVPHGEPGYALRADRELLRTHLWTDIAVNEGKKFDHYVEDADGVTAFFQDGTSVRGSMIVGGDGAHSHVRSQLLGQGPVQSSYIHILAEGTVPPEVFLPLRKIATAGSIGVGDGLRYLIGQHSVAPDESSARYYYSISYHSSTPEVEQAWADHATKEELLQKALEKTSHMPNALTDVIRFIGADGIAHPLIKYLEFVTPESLPTSRVTLMGDALHTMVPFKGAGANTAMNDACDLARIIIANHHDRQITSPAELLKKYEAVAVPRGRKIVLESRAAGEQANRHEGPVGGRINRFKATEGTILYTAAPKAESD